LAGDAVGVDFAGAAGLLSADFAGDDEVDPDDDESDDDDDPEDAPAFAPARESLR
jgi:hypothetical protein